MFQTIISPTPLWLDLLKAVIGPGIAAIFVVVGLVWRDRIERRNAAQEWFERIYITDSIDVLMAHVSALHHALIETRRLLFAPSELSALPLYVKWRALTIVPSVNFVYAFEIAESVVLSSLRKEHAVKLTEDEAHDLFLFCGELLEMADEIRASLLGVRVQNKRDIYTIRTRPLLVNVIRQKEERFLNDESLEIVVKRLATKYSPRLNASANALRKTL